MSYRVEIVPPLNTHNIPKMKENSQDKPAQYIPHNTLRNQSFRAPVDYRKETARISHNGTRADDPYLVELIRRFWIRPPPSGQYKFKASKSDYSTHGQSVIIDNTLKKKVNLI